MIETRFKDTELGRIPEDWSVEKLGKICVSMRLGGNYPNQKENSGRLLVKMGNIQRGYIDLSKVEYIKGAVNENDRLYPGMILLNTRNTPDLVGKVAIWRGEANNAYFNSNLLFLDCDTDKYSTYYINYSFNTLDAINRMKGLAIGTTSVAAVYTRDLVNFQLVIPPTIEQVRIVSTLTNIDNLISSLDKLIEKKQAIKQGAMQQLLTGKKRLKGFFEPWVEKKLREICIVKRGVRVTRESLTTEGQYPVFQNTNYPLGYFNKYNVAANTPFVIVGGSAGLVGFSKINYWAADDCAYFDNCEELNLVFLYHILLLRQNEIKRHVRTASVPRLDRKNIEDLVILIPSLREQSAIASVLSSMDEEISALEAKREKYTAIKQGMMQQLLTGKIRLVETAVKTNATSANVHFRRSVLAAEIAERLYEEPTFGHVKMEKILFLTERLCHIDIGSHYHRDAAGPYDNRALRSIDSQLKKQKWFEVKRTEKGNRYVPMQNRGKHKTYFDKYFSAVLPTFEKIIETFKTQNTERCEIVATLYSAWEDLLHSNKSFTDADIVNEVLNNWHESKKRISQDRWLNAIQWMRENGFAPNV